jgi:hypothetical protein
MVERRAGVRAWLVEYADGKESVHLNEPDAIRAASNPHRVRGEVFPLIVGRRREDGKVVAMKGSES